MTSCSSSNKNNSSSSRFFFTIDVLSDGSEHTGDNGTIFLSVWKRQQQQRYNNSTTSFSSLSTNTVVDNNNNKLWLQDNWDIQQPKARYALSGIGDCFARLCADQRMKLSQTRAIFLPSSSSSGEGLDGIAALLLALQNAGLPSIHIVSPPSNINNNKTSSNQNTTTTKDIEEIAEIILGSESSSATSTSRRQRRSLQVVTCQIPPPILQHSHSPSTSSTASSSTASNDHQITTWWKVYQDEFLQVHAGWISSFDHSSSSNDGSSDQQPVISSLIYLYTLNDYSIKCYNKEENKYTTIALVPASNSNITIVDDILKLYRQLKKGNLPLVSDFDDDKNNNVQISIDYFIITSYTNINLFDTDKGLIDDDDDNDNVQFFYTSPRQRRHQSSKSNSHKSSLSSTTTIVVVDPGILIRSQQVSKYFHDNIGSTYFPFDGGKNDNKTSSSNKETPTHKHEDKSTTTTIKPPPSPIPFFQILESCTSIILRGNNSNSNSNNKKNSYCYSIYDRRITLQDRPLSDEWLTSLKSLQNFLPTTTTTTTTTTKIRPMIVAASNNNNTDDDDENEIDLDDFEDEDDDNDDDEKEDDQNRNGNITNKADPNQQQQQKEDEGNSSACSCSCCPQLVVLGTGCAAPSAIRGASGYALIFPKKQIIMKGDVGDDVESDKEESSSSSSSSSSEILIVDAGEGITTMLSRCQVKISNIIGIWISHAHLDHYGGLPNLVRSIHNIHNGSSSHPESGIQQSFESNTNQNKKRKRTTPNGGTKPVVWVMAPPNVLRFLDLSLNCFHGKHRINEEQFFLPRFHQDKFTSTPRGRPQSVVVGPWTHFYNIPVHHNCCPSYGLLIGWKKRNSCNNVALPLNANGKTAAMTTPNTSTNSNEWFCFSGDTRPCRNLVDAVRCYRLNPNEEPLLLLHEATFADTEQNQAILKKHSTVSEAMCVANDMCANRVLLTHFSQRYIAMMNDNYINDNQTNANNNRSNNNVATTTAAAVNNNDTDNNNNNKWGIPMSFAVDGLWMPLNNSSFF